MHNGLSKAFFHGGLELEVVLQVGAEVVHIVHPQIRV